MAWAEQCFALLPTHHPAAMLLTYPNRDVSHSDQMCDNQSSDDRLAKTLILEKKVAASRSVPAGIVHCHKHKHRPSFLPSIPSLLPSIYYKPACFIDPLENA